MGGNLLSKPEPKYPSEKEAEREENERFFYQADKLARHQRDSTPDASRPKSNTESSSSSLSIYEDCISNPPSPTLLPTSSCNRDNHTDVCATSVKSEVSQDLPQNAKHKSVQFLGRLYEKDVFWLSESLTGHAHRWREIGLALGFAPNSLAVIGSKLSLLASAPNSYLIEMLTTWVQWTPETEGCKYATLKDLIKALQSRTVGLGTVAEEIQRTVTRAPKQSEVVVDCQCHHPVSTSESVGLAIKDHPPTSKHVLDVNIHTPVASDICILVPPDPESATPCDHYAFYLRTYYTRNRKTDNKWPGLEAKEYTNLAVVSNEYELREDYEDVRKAAIYGSIDKILQKKRCYSIEFADILRPVITNSHNQYHTHDVKQVLMEGAPGIGKSTMSWELCKKWGNGELFQEYSLVVILRFRDPWVQKVKSVLDLFHYPGEPELQAEAAKEIKRTQGKGLLLILEGYDEAPPALRELHSLFSELFRGELLPNATVLVTSRPSATQDLRQWCKGESSRRIEVLGFGTNEIESYINSHFTESNSREAFHSYLESYPHIYSMMYVPLNAAIVTHVYQTCKTTSTIIPQTMTQLYTSLVKTLLLRYMKEFREYKNIRIDGFADLPKPVYLKFCEVCQLAYNGIVQPKTKIIFSDLPEDFNSLGLMQSVPELYIDMGVSFSHNFLHLTVQEYLAAYHVSLLGNDRIESFLVENTEKHTMVCRFLAGHCQNNTGPFSRAFITKKSLDYDQLSLDTTALLMLFELHNPHAIANMLQSKTVTFHDTKQRLKYTVCPFEFVPYHWSSVMLSTVYPFDYYTLGYSIRASNCSWKLVLSHANSHFDMLSKALSLYNSLTPSEDPNVAHSLTIVGHGSRNDFFCQSRCACAPDQSLRTTGGAFVQSLRTVFDQSLRTTGGAFVQSLRTTSGAFDQSLRTTCGAFVQSLRTVFDQSLRTTGGAFGQSLRTTSGAFDQSLRTTCGAFTKCLPALSTLHFTFTQNIKSSSYSYYQQLQNTSYSIENTTLKVGPKSTNCLVIDNADTCKYVYIAPGNFLSAPNDCCKQLVILKRPDYQLEYRIPAVSLFDIAETLSSLVSLYLEGLKIEIGDYGVCLLASALTNSSALISLSLHNSTAGPGISCLTALAHVIDSHSTLELLTHVDGHISNNRTTVLAQRVRKNLILKISNLQNHRAGNYRAAELAHALKHDRLLKLFMTHLARLIIHNSGPYAPWKTGKCTQCCDLNSDIFL